MQSWQTSIPQKDGLVGSSPTLDTMTVKPEECCTDAEDRKFYYVCNKCGKPVTTCPDPACMADGVGHHKNEEDWDCRDDVPYDDCSRIYV